MAAAAGILSLLTGLLMTFAYSLTCPVGIAIGIAISSTYDEASVKALAIQVRSYLLMMRVQSSSTS
jgi:hypothetical protein